MPEPKTRKPATRKPAAPRKSRAKKKDEGMRIRLVQRAFDESDVALKHVVLGGSDAVVLINLDFEANEVAVDATRLTLEDMANLFTALAESMKSGPASDSDAKFV
ncbi:hypothetical protein SEA_RIZWANA_55 [Arthrobacter phage Rizwana]|nr:hypothetical protein SEA_RIZWANA_55 [Arthrobacter phage Rizwana]